MKGGRGDARRGLHTSDGEKVPVYSRVDTDPGPLFTQGIYQHGRGHETEEITAKALETVTLSVRHHPVVELSYHVCEVLRTAEVLYEFP
ncbi:unnamed protein product [Dibothriocephalus latus]|uniref:Uncharacterized protein n=1 Tax=Dibothriocephalus latus TaxID=60516 RepID=A0A3P7NUQ0_DIBLA|nr:unnamed protein product [Dibothriocephalus latus]